MTGKHLWRPKPSTSLTSGLALIAVAISLITLSNSFDGFVQGLLGGAGVMLALIAVVALSPLVRGRLGRGTHPGSADGTGDTVDTRAADDPDDAERGWLPSRDSRP